LKLLCSARYILDYKVVLKLAAVRCLPWGRASSVKSRSAIEGRRDASQEWTRTHTFNFLWMSQCEVTTIDPFSPFPLSKFMSPSVELFVDFSHTN
jgi:hypothetical protein